MAEIIWAPSALEDIEKIAQYIARDSEEQAFLFVRRLLSSVKRLEDFPDSGRIIPEIGRPNNREIIYSNYRIMYKLSENEVWITGIIHGSMDWEP